MRDIWELFWHCTATRPGHDPSMRTVGEWHKARGWGISYEGRRYHEGYHKLVRENGDVEVGRPEGCVGAHVAGHNTHSLGYVYTGGVDHDGRTPRDTRTPAQKRRMVELTVDAIKRHALTAITGHNERAAKACPSFDASAEYDHLLLERGVTERRRSPADAILSRGDRGTRVRQWTRKLAAAGHIIREGDLFDQDVERVTRWFQASRGIVIDGTVGPQTRAEMQAVLQGDPAPVEIAIAPEAPSASDVVAAVRAALDQFDPA